MIKLKKPKAEKPSPEVKAKALLLELSVEDDPGNYEKDRLLSECETVITELLAYIKEFKAQF